MRLVCCLTAFMLLISGQTVSAQDDKPIPPPLAFSDFATDPEQYSVYDFETGGVRVIARTGGKTGTGGFGETVSPEEFTLQSPYYPVLQVHLIQEDDDDYSSYSLYSLPLTEGQQPALKRIYIDAWASPFWMYWSPNGSYLYLFADNPHNRHRDLYQYDLYEEQARLLVSDVNSFQNDFDRLDAFQTDNCVYQSAWCWLRHTDEETEASGQQTLLLLDKDSGTLFPIASDSRGRIDAWWTNEGSALIYRVSQNDEHEALHVYDVESHADRLLAEINARRLSNPLRSPDGHWLAVTGWVNPSNISVIFVIDTREPNTEVLRITDGLKPTGVYRWTSPDHLFFRAADLGTAEEGFYVTTLPNRGTHSTFQFTPDLAPSSMGLSDWSPDGRWFAFSLGDSIQVIDGLAEVSPFTLAVDFSDYTIICLGWYTVEVYASGKAFLCDIYQGIG